MKEKIIKQEKGITLIALVITIIVLLILAGVAISMLSGENGILNKASEAKTQTENKSEEEQVKLAATEAMMTTADYTVKYDNLTKVLNEQLGTGTYTISPEEDTERWEIEVTKTKNHYAITKDGTAKHLAWWYTGENKGQITDGKQILTLGDEIQYDPTAGLTATDGVYKKYESLEEKNGRSDQVFTLENNLEQNGQKLEWRVLGTDDDGNVLIMPTECVKDKNGSTQFFALYGKKCVQYGIEELNNISAIYGHGTGAQSARSIKEEDIAKVVNPTLSSGVNVYDYGTKVTYKLNNSGNIEGSWYKDGDLQQSTSTGSYFEYFDGKTFKKLTKGQSVTLTCTYKEYNVTEADCKNNPKLAKLLTSDEYYWLGTLTTITYGESARWNLSFCMAGVSTDMNAGFWSNSLEQSNDLSVCPVVSLKSSINYVETEKDSGVWKIQ